MFFSDCYGDFFSMHKPRLCIEILYNLAYRMKFFLYNVHQLLVNHISFVPSVLAVLEYDLVNYYIAFIK
jgi:hypothetical protein